MIASLIDGRALAAERRRNLAGKAAQLTQRRGAPARLDVVLVGDDPASLVYVAAKAKAAASVGIDAHAHRLAAGAGQSALETLIRTLSADRAVDGILVQLPLPIGYDPEAALAVLDPAKDVDGLSVVSQGLLARGRPGLRPCTPLGIVDLARAAVGGPLAGAHCVVIGRSVLVGRSTAALMLAEDCTVSLLHSKSRAPEAIARSADILVAAIGRPGAIGAEFVKPGAIVIDVGIHRLAGGGLIGDVDFPAIADFAGAVTPVPGGVGPMTIAHLLENTYLAALGRGA